MVMSNGKWGAGPGFGPGISGGASGFDHAGLPPYRTDGEPPDTYPAWTTFTKPFRTPLTLSMTGGAISLPSDSAAGGMKTGASSMRGSNSKHSRRRSGRRRSRRCFMTYASFRRVGPNGRLLDPNFFFKRICQSQIKQVSCEQCQRILRHPKNLFYF